MKVHRLRAGIFLALGVLLIIALLAGIAIGSVPIPLSDLLKILVSPFSPHIKESVPDTWLAIVLRLRLPRVLAAMLVGCALGLSGSTMQGLFKNPLADPFIIGVSSGASVGAAAAMLLGLAWTKAGAFAIPLAAFAGGMGSLLLVYSLSGSGGRRSTLSLLLAGTAVSTFLGAVVALLTFFSGEQLQQVVFWMMGGFSGRNWLHVLSMLPWLAVGGAVIIWHARDLDALSLGEEQAYYMGVNVEKVKARLLAASALLAAAAVSVSGLIGFVGLVVPHAMRLIGGPSHRWLLPASALAGAVFMVASDLLARVVLAPVELPVGLVTALVGGPFFLYLLKRRKVT
jgi:iron complex transport system permease protein